MPESQRLKSKIFNYTINEFEDVRHDTWETCEDVCRKLCIQHGFTPVVETLFGLRYAHTQGTWLPGCCKLDIKVEYEFRLRFKIDPVSKLSELNKEAYNYYYFQVRHDLLANDILGLDYSQFTNKILGLCTTDMYRELIEKTSTEEELKKNYRNYIPRDIRRHYRLFVKRRIYEFLDNIKHKSHDKFFIREAYLKDVHKMAPDYLTETFTAESDYLPEDGYTEKGLIQVKIQVAPHHKETPGIRIYYPYKDSWEDHKMENLTSMMLDKDSIYLQVKNLPRSRKFAIKDRKVMESFISCVSGYYRLMEKWTVNICPSHPSPLLNKLLDMKCHGPIGGAFSYKKLERNGFKTGNYIIRQCEETFGHFLLDIVIRSDPETFKIVQTGQKFIFHKRDGSTQTFDTLQQLAESIELPKNCRHMRCSPVSEKDRPMKLLLCAAPEKIQAQENVNDFSKMENKAPRIIQMQSLLLHKQTLREVDYRRMAEYQADLLLPTNKKIDCKIKYLKTTHEQEYIGGFMDLADFWAGIDSPDIIRLFGVTLQSSNRCLVLESYKSDLKQFLRDQKQTGNKVPTLNLIDAAQCLAKALYYLQDVQIVHGQIRCCNVFVKSYEPNSSLVVKLGDPGLPRLYDVSDMPWIPLEHFDNLERAKTDLKTDIWAYATTIWEILSHGYNINIPNPKEFFANGGRLKPPLECEKCRDVYDIMQEGWEEDPDKRFSSQFVTSRLTMARNRFDNPYNEIPTNHVRNHTESESTDYTKTNISTFSGKTEITVLPDEYLPMLNGHDPSNSNSSLHSGHSNSSLLHRPMSHNSCEDDVLQPFMRHEAEEFQREYLNKIIILENSTITFKKLVGEGNYGQVYEGTLVDGRMNMNLVALKVLSTASKEKLKDALLEAKIMQKLCHPNIVRIFLYNIDEYSNQLVIVMELIKNGSLDIYLKSNRPKIKSIRLMKFAKDIASGMEYLQNEHIVHRDLAARNILVVSDDCVKISDFGLARLAGDNDYYDAITDRALPILWHAPEGIRHNKFSSLSDVWSFGIVLFEMFSCGEKPYNELSSKYTGEDRPAKLTVALDKQLFDGVRMDRPDNCPEIVYTQLMEPCWEYNPRDRPSFTKLLADINTIIEQHKDDIDFNTCYT